MEFIIGSSLCSSTKPKVFVDIRDSEIYISNYSLKTTINECNLTINYWSKK